ncbi:MAG: YceD family protein [Pseudomonadales bacterium]|jgi:uncharacterized protein|nr:YceD family protein [Pseudomonadales bacterium]
MSPGPFPEHLDALKLFARNGSVSATLPLSKLPRFAAYLLDTEGEVAVALHFGHDEEGRPLLSGSLRTEVRVSCQRCMEPLELELDCELALLALASEAEVQALSSEEAALDALVMDPEQGLDVLAVIEDELLLSLPLVPMHMELDCSEAFNAYQRQAQQTAASEAKQSPFAALAALKGNDGQ